MPKVVCVAENNMNGDRAKPDLEIKVNGERYLIDVNFCKNDDDVEKRFEEK